MLASRWADSCEGGSDLSKMSEIWKVEVLTVWRTTGKRTRQSPEIVCTQQASPRQLSTVMRELRRGEAH